MYADRLQWDHEIKLFSEMSVLLSYYHRGQWLISHFSAPWTDEQSLGDSSNCSIVGEIVVGRVTMQFFLDPGNESLVLKFVARKASSAEQRIRCLSHPYIAQ